jgi:type II secretory pathway pseudopilin PulG
MGIKIFGTLVVLMVTTVIIAGLIIAGSPATERAHRFDDQRVSDLQQISSAVDLYVSKTGRLPSSLNELTNPEVARLYNLNSTTDPETFTPYEYSTTSKTTYKLCAKFTFANIEKPSTNTRGLITHSYNYSKAWGHSAGKKCFDLLSTPPLENGKNHRP